MKKIFPFVLLALCTARLHAQTGLYIKAGAGYAIPNAGQTVSVDGTPFNGSINNQSPIPLTTKSTYNVKKASFSAGFQAGVGLGYMFTPHLGLELNINAIVSPRQFSANDSNEISPAGSAYEIEHITRHASFPVLLTPSLVYNTGGKKLSGYARGGIVLPLNIKLIEEFEYVNGFSEADYIRFETTCKFGAGFSGAMGIAYKADKNVSVWAEANILSMSVYAKQSRVTKHTYKGSTTTITPSEGTIIKYSNNGAYNYIGSNNILSTSMPAYSIPFSNLGVAIGVSVALQKQKEDDSRRK